MASNLSPEDRAYFEDLLAKAEPYDEDDPAANRLDGEQDPDRMMALIAKKILEGRL